MKKKVKKGFFAGGVVLLVVSLTFFLQKTFVPPPLSEHQPKWAGSDLATLKEAVEKKEKEYPNLKKDCERKIFFAGKPVPTEYSFVYMPGFTATRKEIFPVVETLAKQFSANYFMTRFPAHGEAPLDYKNLTSRGFFDVTYEALEIASKLGKKKIFIGTSTGAALITSALVQGADIDAAVLLSPAFRTLPSYSWLLSTRLGPLIFKLAYGDTYHWTPTNPEMEKYWNTSYHGNGAVAVVRSIEHVASLDFSKIKVPVLMLYTKQDTGVDPNKVIAKFAEIVEPRKRLVEIPSSHHVIAGEFTSPETTELVIKEIHDWLQTLDL